ncbi:MAG: Methionine aminopeptidase [Candidatus Woesebacteria bacterium GW2011_GWA1_40_43]|uniref:Methionine aminopeptidase n=4 Tax=Microgenomates group TaxID=1794810 RepID=A0A0G1NBJ8_9BACT|nr:MAG: Methionine aminopeptidase [Candidatus Woesebacteria bacterium GW2011_GWA1_40_43]KKT66470.1 MAG: Methionine aminopeptidase [Candidatus Curtissbacteria bacterium GW2011_GWC1_44_33]KKT67142.1 MAG: Methionine aminopeptidase [Candidatus Woesebacteria bacterium GW2011_GWA2_44_33]KKU17722.1 MAG: Methionine aminopeptidase [Candidatus Woesebacteria bacterium GW2011_GWC2_45_9]
MENKIFVKSPGDIQKMAEGGKKLSKIKKSLKRAVSVGATAGEIEELAVHLIKEEGGKPSFMMVPNYQWATCVNVNKGLVHGIPKPEIVFKKGDVVSVDVGLFYQGFHTDTSFSLGLEADAAREFLKCGEEALKKAIKTAKTGNYIFDISKTIEETLLAGGYRPIRALVGHGVGRHLHEGPQIPCFTNGRREESPRIVPGMVLAIEVMYTQGSGEVEIGSDGWTIFMRDGKMAALYEETVAVTSHGSLVLTG